MAEWLPAITVETVIVPMRDGAGLVADVFLPATVSPGPTLLTRTPYGRSASRLADDLVGLARDGWRVVVQDVRGRGDSTGEFRPFHQEVADGADTVAWCRRQPWSDGRVAMFGGSYRAATQWLAASGAPEGLLAMAPAVASADLGEGWTFEGGIPTAAFLRAWALRFAATDPAADSKVRSAAQALADSGRSLSIAETPDDVLGELFPAFRSWLDPGDSEYWEPLDLLRGHIPDVAAYHVAGWYDQFCEGGLRAYSTLTAAGRAPQRLVVGPWWHGGLGIPAIGDCPSGPGGDAGQIRLWEEQFAWLRRALEPEPGARVDSGVTVFEMQADRWLDLTSWPPAGTRTMTLYLASAGALGSTQGSDQTGSDVISHDPSDPTPNVGGRLFTYWPRSGPIDQHTVENRPEIACYTSAPLSGDIDVVGSLEADVVVIGDTEADLVLRVCDVDPDGRSLNVVEQAHRLRLGPGRRESLRLDVGSIAWRFGAGHRIRLQLAGAAWPRLQPRPHPFTLRVIHDGSRLHLPLLGAQPRFHETA